MLFEGRSPITAIYFSIHVLNVMPCPSLMEHPLEMPCYYDVILFEKKNEPKWKNPILKKTYVAVLCCYGESSSCIHHLLRLYA